MGSKPQWWIAQLGDFLIWARLRVRETGVAEVFGSDGETLKYDDEDAARQALLDAEFRAFDGLDADDAAEMGFDLQDTEPPQGTSDEDVLPFMTQRVTRRN